MLKGHILGRVKGWHSVLECARLCASDYNCEGIEYIPSKGVSVADNCALVTRAPMTPSPLAIQVTMRNPRDNFDAMLVTGSCRNDIANSRTFVRDHVAGQANGTCVFAEIDGSGNLAGERTYDNATDAITYVKVYADAYCADDGKSPSYKIGDEYVAKKNSILY